MTNSSANPTPQKYFFDSEFDYSETVEDIQSITPKKYSADIDNAKAQAFQEGHQAGVKETNENIARIASDQLFVITSKIEELIETEAEIMNRFHIEIAQVADLVTQKVIPTLAEQGASKEIRGMLDRVKDALPKDQKITITVHPSLKAEIEAHIGSLKDNSNFEAQIFVADDPGLNITDCTATWKGAGIKQFMDLTMTEIHDSLLRLAKTPLEFKPQVEVTDEPSEDADEVDASSEDSIESADIDTTEQGPETNTVTEPSETDETTHQEETPNND